MRYIYFVAKIDSLLCITIQNVLNFLTLRLVKIVGVNFLIKSLENYQDKKLQKKN